MKKVKYTIRTLSPVVISSESGNQFMVPTKEYIPGIVILGALAVKYINKNKLDSYFQQAKPDDPNFLNWFINGAISYSNGYKVDKIHNTADNSVKDYATIPLPFSVQHLKNDEKEIYDLLNFSCEEQTKPFGGYGVLTDGKLFKTIVHKSTDPHHERDYTTGAPKKGIFFNYESISAFQTFEGTIWGKENIINNFFEFFKSTNNLRIGRSKTSEYSVVEFNLSDDSESSSNEIKLDDDGKISLTFLSNFIIYNDNGFPTCQFSDLEKYLTTVLSGKVTIEKAFLRSEEVENYVSVWKLKKPSEISFQSGSCLLLKIDKDAVDQLAKLQNEGIGERKHEGFGRIAFGLQNSKKLDAHNFHVELHPKPTSNKIPELVKETTLRVCKDYLLKSVEVEALELVNRNAKQLREDKKISSSQISRLEGFVRISKTDEDFKKSVGSLRKTSLEKLSNCHLENTNLFILLTDEDILKNEKVLERSEEVKLIFSEVNLNQNLLDEIKKDLFRAYYLTLFAAMRKALKGGN